jgi:hypothetical protein
MELSDESPREIRCDGRKEEIMWEHATANASRCIHAGRTCDQHRRDVQRRRQQQHGHQRAGQPKTISLELAKAQTKLLEASLLR